MQVIIRWDDKRKRPIRVLCLPSKESPPVVAGSLSKYEFDRIVMYCKECKRYHYASVLPCPPADAEITALATYGIVQEDAD